MIYDHKCLKEDEALAVRALMDRYNGYDKLDILIELVIENPHEFLKRKPKQTNIQKEVLEALPEALKFCDGDKCSIF